MSVHPIPTPGTCTESLPQPPRADVGHGMIDGWPVRMIELQGHFKAWTEGAWAYVWGPTPERAAEKLRERYAAEAEVVADTCDVCNHRHGLGDPECDGMDEAP